MKMEDKVRSVYEPMRPLPGGEDRMWTAIDRALDGKAKNVQIRVQPRRQILRPVLVAAALLLLLAVSFTVLRRLSLRPENGELLAAEATPEVTPEPSPERIRETRALELVNAQVNDSPILTLSEEQTLLARAVLPEGCCVDHWEINGKTSDAGERRFSLQFDSTGVKKVEAVLREERRVTCVNAYLQFLDESGEPAGWFYEDLSFEYAYTVPTTGETHPGGSITACVTPLSPEGMELDHWLIDGERLETEIPPCAILLDGLDRSIRIEAVLRENTGTAEAGERFSLGGGSAPALTAAPPKDDLPAGQSEPPSNLWQEIDYERDGVPFDPDAPARDGHLHQWVVDPSRSWNSTCTVPGKTTRVCSVCGHAYSTLLPCLAHSFEWAFFPDSIYVYDVCTVCGYQVRLDITIYDLGLEPRPTPQPTEPAEPAEP